MSKKITTKEWIEKAKEKHNSYYDYSKSIYISVMEYITITCPIHGDFKQKPRNHIVGSGCKQCGKNKSGVARRLDKSDFLIRADEKHGKKYIYDKVDYVTTKDIITIVCPIHGDFKQKVENHLRGHDCKQCGNKKRAITQKTANDSYIENAKTIHNGLYEYSKTNYTGAKNKVIITCNTHGDFEQVADNHLSGQGCPKCNVRGWSKSEYINFSPTAILYVIECFNKNERFIKVGITIGSVKNRFKNSLPYEYKIIMTLKGSSSFIYDFENVIHREIKSFSYRPKIKFGGYTECFKSNNDIISIIKNKSFNNEENTVTWNFS